MNYSLRKVLLCTLLPTVTLIWGGTAALSYRDARNEIAELLDAEMAQSARFLLTLADSGFNPDNPALTASEHIVLSSDAGELEHQYEKKLARQLWLGHERLLLRTEDAPQQPLSNAGNGYSLETVSANTWHIYSQTDATGRFIVHIGQSADVRQKITDDITRDLLLQYLVGMPLIAALIWFCVGYVLRPLGSLVREVEQREDQLLTPLHVEHVPREVKPLADAFNTLLDRLAQVFDHERRFTADAAHELRTPLAGIKTQADVALRATEAGIRDNALQQIKNGVERMDHLVGQLLTLARLDPETGLLTPKPVDLDKVLRFAKKELDVLARQKSIQIQTRCQAHPAVKGHPH
ncbi:MAG: HAMP domain-containing protein, partial [Methylococcaceae bacterium]